MGGEDARHFGEGAGFVEDDDAQSRIAALAVLLPPQVDPVGVDAVGEAGAVDDMDLDPLARPREPDDAVARHRVTAIGELVGDAGGQSTEGRRVGKEGDRTCSSRWSPDPYNKQQKNRKKHS